VRILFQAVRQLLVPQYVLAEGETNMQDLQFSELMERVAAGDQDAIWVLAETYTPYIIRAVRAQLSRRIRPRLDSQDFAQILWASLLLGDVDLRRLTTQEMFIAFLARAAKNKVVDATRHYLRTQSRDVRRERRWEEIQFAADHESETKNAPGLRAREASPSDLAIMRERWDRILSQASERDRQIVQMRLENYSFNQISRQLNVHRTTVRRAMERLLETVAK
jgi:RNA polymerase sigma factor (sigma-70 family)